MTEKKNNQKSKAADSGAKTPMEGQGKKTSVKDTIQESLIMKMQDEASQRPKTGRVRMEASSSSEWESPVQFRTSGKKMPAKQINFFLRQMSVLLSSGIPLMRTLKILTNRMRHADFRITLINVMEDVERGTQFWAALAKHPDYFNKMMVNVIRTGEESGSLVSAMNYLANYRDREEEMVRNVQKAVTYPLFLLILALGVVIFLMTTVIPIFADQFKQLGTDLPWATRFVLSMSETMTNFWLIIILFGLGGYLFYKRIDTSQGLRGAVDRIKLKMPIFGKILVNIYTVQFATMTPLLLRSGLPLLKTLDLVRDTSINIVFRNALEYVRQNVERGRSLFEALNEVNVFPPIVLDMIAVGEEAGSLPEVLDQVAESYQKEVDHDTAIIGTLLEPILIVGMGLIVGFIAISVFLPYFSLINVVVP